MNVPNLLIQKAFYWKKNVQGVNIVPVFTHEGIPDENLRLNIIRKEEARLRFYDARNNGTDKTWYDRSTNSLYVYLPNIANEQELDTLLLERVSALSGLSGLLGRDVTDGIGRQVFDNLRPDVQSKLSLSASGNALSGFERAYAGKKYLGDCVEHVTTAEDRKKAFSHWKFMFARYIQVAKPGFWNSLSIDMNMKLNALASGLRGRFFQKSEKRQMEKEGASTEHVKERLVEWYDREHLTEEQASKLNNPLDKYIDRLDYIRIGYPSPVLLSAMADSRSALIQLPACGLYGHPGDDLGERYILPENGMKKDKHPFELTDVLTLKEELDAPLAVFRSRDPHKTSSSVVMLESMSSNPECPGTFCVALTPKEVNPVDHNGRDSMKGSGRWVNNVDSIYPRGDMSFIMFLKTPGLTTYLAPGFEEKWLKPAVQRMEAYYDKVFAASGMEKPTGELLELLVNGAVYEYWLTQEDIKNIDRSLVTSRERSGLLAEYATYHVAVESATNVVRKFENPKIIDENIEFSIQNEDLSPRVMMEKVLDKILEDNPEKLRRIAYLCVKGSPAFGNELPPVNPVSYVADMQYGELKETIMEHWPKLSEDARISIHAEFSELPNLSLDENTKYEDARKLFFTLTLDDKCRFMGYAGKNDAWKDLMNWHPMGGPDWKLDEDMLSGGIDNMFKQATTEDVIEKYVEWKNDGFKDSETYALATDMTMFMAKKLNEHGIKTIVITDEKANEVLRNVRETGANGTERIDFSVRDIMNLSYTWNGEEVSMRGFAEQFMSEIKQKDRTMEDAERIAKAFIEAVKTDPEKAGMKMLKAENMANAFRFKLPDGTIYTPEHPLASSPEYETQKGLWLIYENVLGRETMNEFVGLLSKNAPMSVEERKRFTELESKVNGSDLMQRSLEVPASKVNENRVRDIRNLIQYFEGNEDYTWTEKALIVKGAMSFGYSEKKESDQTKIEIKNISDNNSVAVPVIGGEAAAVVEGLRKGLNFKDALVQARISLSKESKRSVARNFTGWKVYRQSDKEEDAVILNQDVAGTGWCTGGAVSTARSHLSGGDFHVYYEAGEPLIAIRTQDGRMAEPPRGAHEGQFCEPREEQIAFDYIKSGNGIIAGDDYIADIEDIRRIMSPDATPMDAFMFPEKRRYENGEYGGDTSAWGDAVERRIAELVPNDIKARQNLGFYYGDEIEDAIRNANAIAIKGHIELFGSASLTLPEGVTQVGNIELADSASMVLPKGVTTLGNILLLDSASLTISEGVTKLGDIRLDDSASLTLPEGVTQVRNIVLWDSTSMALPEGVTKLGDISLSGSTSLALPKGVTKVGDIDLHDSTSLTIPEGVTQVGKIELFDSSSLTLSEGVTKLGNIKLFDSSSLTLPEGVTQVGDIRLDDSTSLTLPEGVTQVGDICLHDSASLTLPEGVTQVGYIVLHDSTSLTLPEGVTQVGDIELRDNASLTIPEGVTQVGYTNLYDSTSLTLPEGVTQVGDIYLHDNASLTLPKGMTQVGKIDLYNSTSLTLPEGVTQVGKIELSDSASLTLPEGVTQVGSIQLWGSASLTLPEGVTQVGGIDLHRTTSLTLPEGVTQVGNIRLHDSASLTLPKGVTQVGYIVLHESTSLSLPDSVTQVGDIVLSDSASLTLPEGLTQVGTIRLSPGSSITFPDGFALRNETSDRMHYSAEKINELVTKHQKKVEFRLSNGTVYGYQTGDTIYLTPEGINPNTPIHEYAHLWAKVYEKLRPDEWKSLKEELKALPQWKEIAESESYSFIESDENRLAGEVLATIVGNKGEELMLSAARDTLKEGERADESVVKGAEYFRQKVTDMAVKDVFDAEGLERTGEVTLKVLKDFAEGKGVKMSKEEGERLAAMVGTSSSGDKLVRVVDIMPDKSISGKSDILAKIPSGGIVVFNEESNAGVTVSRKAIRHSLQRLNETTIACAYNIEKIINNAKLLGNLPVAIDEIEHTRAVMVYYCPVRIGEELISARLLIKQLENNGRVIESLSFYNITPHKKREASPVPNVKGFPGVYSDDKLSSCKIKDIIHNTQDYDKILAGIEAETSFHIDKDASSEFTYNNKPDMTNLDFVSYAASDISKAALFVAWEIRDDNPYEFVANLSRAELEDFLKNSFEKLNAEDKDIVTNILNKAPGYDEDFVEKRINSEISPWFNNLSLEDKMRVFSFYHYTPGVEESPIGVLDNNDDVKVLNKTYEAAIGVPIDIPEVDESVVRDSIEKMLISAFESISDTSKAQVYRDVVASGLHANTLMTNATNIKIAFPERKEQLLALSPNDPGARMLEDMYEYNLLWDGINPRTPGKIQEEIAAAAEEADEIIIVTPTSESLSWQITNLILKDKLHDGNKIFIRDERMNELKTMEISSVRKEPNVEYDLKYAECSLSVFLHDNGTIKSCVEHYGEDLLGNHVDGAVYHFAKSGMLLSAEKGNAVQSPVHAIEDLQKSVQENIGKMNVLEIAGLRDVVAKLNEPLSYFRHEMSNGDHVIGVSTRFSIDDRMGAFKELQDTIERNYEKARSEFFEYAGRGFKANNNLWDRLMRRTFTPTYPLPPMDDLKIEGRQHKQGAVSLDEIGTDKIPLDFYNRFLDRCLQPGGPDIDVNAMPKMSTMTEISKVPTGVITESEIAEIPTNYREQLALTGRIDGPVSATNGELVLVQKDNDTLVTLRPSEAREILMTLGGQERLKIDGREFQVSLDELKNLSFGVGQHLTPADGGEKAYVVFDIKQQRPVVATSFDSLLRKELRSAREEANKRALKEGLTQSQEQKNGKGRGGRS